VASGQTQDNADRTSGDGICRSSTPLCYRPEDLFINDVPLKHVGSLGEVGSGKWYFDYAADKIYFADDPTGKVVEASVSRAAFSGNADNVTIQSLTIEKYANPLQQGAVAPGAFGQTGGRNWLVQDNIVRDNHGEGIRINEGARLLRNTVHHQGQVGIAGFGSNALVEGNEVYANNFAGVNPNWAAGGIKFNGATSYVNSDIVMRNNNVHDNDGYGLWCDFNCLRTIYEGNQVARNSSWGISQEIAGSATISNNILTDNGGGIFISTSRDVEVTGNTITGPWPMVGLDENRGTGAFGTLVLINLYVHDNTITLPAGVQNSHHIGVIQTRGVNDAFTSGNNRFVSNHYTLSGVQRPFAWLNAYRTSSEWRTFGLDSGGTFTP
jgi:parallel beta-helix repeat protein